MLGLQRGRFVKRSLLKRWKNMPENSRDFSIQTMGSLRLHNCWIWVLFKLHNLPENSRLRFPLRGSVFCRHRLSSPVILKTQLARLISNFVDAFTGSAFKGNPAVVCLLEENKDDQWLQVLAAEFNLSETCYLTWLTDSGSAPRCCSNLLAKHLFSPKFCKH